MAKTTKNFKVKVRACQYVPFSEIVQDEQWIADQYENDCSDNHSFGDNDHSLVEVNTIIQEMDDNIIPEDENEKHQPLEETNTFKRLRYLQQLQIDTKVKIYVDLES